MPRSRFWLCHTRDSGLEKSFWGWWAACSHHWRWGTWDFGRVKAGEVRLLFHLLHPPCRSEAGQPPSSREYWWRSHHHLLPPWKWWGSWRPQCKFCFWHSPVSACTQCITLWSGGVSHRPKCTLSHSQCYPGGEHSIKMLAYSTFPSMIPSLSGRVTRLKNQLFPELPVLNSRI